MRRTLAVTCTPDRWRDDDGGARAAPHPVHHLRGAAYWWGVGGVAALFTDAIVQLGGRGIETVAAGLTVLEWLALIVLALAFAYGEGVRALARRWVPAMDRRARELTPASPWQHRILAPLYAASMIAAPRRVLARAWIGAVLIVAAVLIVRALPTPWRGIVDLSVAAALAIGLLAIGRSAVRTEKVKRG